MSDPTLADLAARLQRLEDIEAIKRLKYLYFRSIDTADIDALEPILAEDIEVDYHGGAYHWQLTGKAPLMEALRHAFHAKGLAQHTGHHPEIDILTPTTATGLWYLTDVFTHLDTLHEVGGGALYRDTYVKEGNQWKIKTTGYVRVFETSELLKEAPTVTFSRLALTGKVRAVPG